MKDSRQSREHAKPLLLHRREITANATESGSPSRTAKGVPKLLLDFGEASVALGLVIGKKEWRGRRAKVPARHERAGHRADSWLDFAWTCLSLCQQWLLQTVLFAIFFLPLFATVKT